ncbi:MAG: cytochrome c-type biogenesis CcmF C-terminal domain-containing protein [Actinomycetota bacterium]|nr:cytochrome c-type biogenesis CcmF C-terminal domain-containing protein [Actinomycetota bacterium]
MAFAGYLAVVVALVAAAVLVIQSLRSTRSGSKEALRLPVLVFVGASVAAFVFLEIAILTHDFSIAYVANNTATTTPFLFLFAGAWAALEGSILLWGLLLAIFTYLVWRSLDTTDGLGVLALGVMGMTSIFWFGLMATVANPFAVCTAVANGFCSDSSWWPLAASVAPAEGAGPNPLLQNHILMAVHPPMLYVGYVGFTVPFSFAIAALWRRDSGRTWLDVTHRWSLISWGFLLFGILLGAWWSYEVLGWGGYWAWDPVENAALLPWLTATAFIHSAIVQRKRGMLQAWNFILVITTFALTIFGTFLTRSGIIASVHAFSQSTIGPILLMFLAVIVIGSLTLFAMRAQSVAQAPRLDSLSSREGYILANNLLLTVFAFTVLFGTLYPIMIQAVSGDEVAVGRPFFDRAAVPLSLLLLLVLGIGCISPWRVASPELLWRRLRSALAIGLVAAAGTVALGVQSVAVIITIGLALFVGAAITLRFVELARKRPEGFIVGSRKVFTHDSGYWGGQVAHVGIVLVAIALATTNGLAVRETIALSPGDSATVAGYCIKYLEPFSMIEPSRVVQGVRVAVMDESCSTARTVLSPRLNTYDGFPQPIGTPDVWTGLVDDVYISIAGGSAERIELAVFIFPLQWLLWVGGSVVVAGGAIALGRRPRRREPSSDEVRAADSGVSNV